MRIRALGLFGGVLATCMLVGCASTRTIRTQSDLDSLPQSRGVYGGSWLIHTWLYEGSDGSYDHFVYTYTHDNFARRIPVRMATGFVVLGFEPTAYRLPDGGMPVTADYRDGRLVAFAAYTNTMRSLPGLFR
jgi:hypothetical protein